MSINIQLQTCIKKLRQLFALKKQYKPAVFVPYYNNIKYYCFPNFTSQLIKTCHSNILHILQPSLSNFEYIYSTFTVILFTLLNFEETPENNFPRKRKCLSERDTHKSVTAQQGRKSWGRRTGRGKKMPPSTVVNEEYLRRSSQVHCGNATI